MKVERCSCTGKPTRICDLCRSPSYVYLACGRACLRTHQVAAHGSQVPENAEERVRIATRDFNRNARDAWDAFASHRRTLMDALPQVTGDLCVFGAGNCYDLDVDQLSQRFNQIHLVDLDKAALERSRDRQTAQVRARLVLHDLDLSGFLDRIDQGPENFPGDAQLAQSVFLAANRLVRGLGRTFDVTLSTCVLSQLTLPYNQVWIMPESTLQGLQVATTAVHLATLVGATRPGGSGFIAFDVLSSDDFPQLLDFRGGPRDALQTVVDQAVDHDEIELAPHPGDLLEHLASPTFGASLGSTHLTPPWLWDIQSEHQLVYGIGFQRRA